MGTTWQQWSAASLASGAVLLVLGSLSLPADGSDIPGILASVKDDSGKWVMASFAFLLASAAMTVGLPSVVALMRTRGQRFGLVAVGTWALGSVGLAGYAALLIFFRTVERAIGLSNDQARDIAGDPSLVAFVLLITVAFVVGEMLTAAALLYARAVPPWVGVLLLVHALLATVAEALPTPVERAQVLLFGVALMGIAIQASAGVRTARH